MEALATVLQGPRVWAQLPPPRLWSGDADEARAPERQHEVEGMYNDGHLGRPTFVRESIQNRGGDHAAAVVTL